MLCPSLWKQDTRTSQCYFMHMLTSPKPNHRYDIITDLFQSSPCLVWVGSLHTLTCLFSLGDSSTRQKNVSKSNSEGHVWLEAPPASHDKPCCCYWFTLNDALPVVGCWTGNLPDFYEHSRLQPKVPSERNQLGMSCWNESADRCRFIHGRPFLCLNFFLFLRKSPFFLIFKAPRRSSKSTKML